MLAALTWRPQGPLSVVRACTRLPLHRTALATQTSTEVHPWSCRRAPEISQTHPTDACNAPLQLHWAHYEGGQVCFASARLAYLDRWALTITNGAHHEYRRHKERSDNNTFLSAPPMRVTNAPCPPAARSNRSSRTCSPRELLRRRPTCSLAAALRGHV